MFTVGPAVVEREGVGRFFASERGEGDFALDVVDAGSENDDDIVFRVGDAFEDQAWIGGEIAALEFEVVAAKTPGLSSFRFGVAM